jgi:Ca2+-binding RTX toxin-like protein
MSVTDELKDFFGFLRNDAAAAALDGDAVPLIGAALAAIPGATDFLPFDEIQGDLEAALAGVNENDPAAIAAAIEAIPGDEVKAVVDGDNVNITFSVSDTTSIDLPDGKFDVGVSGLGLEADATFDATIETKLSMTIAFNTKSGEVEYVDAPGEEFQIGVDVFADVNGAAELAGIGVELKDVSTDPEIQLDFGLDIHDLKGDVESVVNGNAHVELDLKTTGFSDILPTFYADLDADWTFAGDTASSPVINVDLSVDLGSLVDDLVGIFEPLTDILNSFPFGDIIDAVTDPIPVIDDLFAVANAAGLKDPIPLDDGDGTFNFLDAAYFYYQGNADAQEDISQFAEALAIINFLRDLAAGGEGKIELGSFQVGGAFDEATDILKDLTDEIINSEIFKDVVEGIENVTEDLDPNPLGGGFKDETGISFPLLENPEQVLQILFPELVGKNDPVDLIRFDLPALSYDAQLGPYFFPILYVLGISLSGAIEARVDLTIGYDTTALSSALAGGDFDFLDGIFLTTKPLDDPDTKEVESDNPDTWEIEDDVLPPQHKDYDELPPDHVHHTHQPAGFVYAEVHAGAGVSLLGSGAFLEGGLLGSVYAFFPNGKLRYSDVAGGCIFDPMEGQIGMDLSARITIDFGLFEWTKRFTIAEVTLADFTVDCVEATGEPDVQGLAQPDPNLVTGPNLRLNVGPNAGSRTVAGEVGKDVAETWHVRNAVDDKGVLIPDTLTVSAFGVDQNYGSSANPMTKIVADFGNENDALEVGKDVGVFVEAKGGAGLDYLAGGLGNDTLLGEDGEDYLTGRDGNDSLVGGAHSDFFEGGAGADTIEGGAGDVDQVTYEHSAVAVEFEYKNAAGGFVGKGGEAEGDILKDVEYIIGSDLKAAGDKLFGNPSSNNMLEGLSGNDQLVGGNLNDFLIGGPGADVIAGQAGARDATTYVGSLAGVNIDLHFNSAWGGDATGDAISGIEDVQGSAFDDRLLGSNVSNVLHGFLGNDVLEGRGGADNLNGSWGNDTIRAGADGDFLDGGEGVDLLDYSWLPFGSGPVTVNLGTFDGGGTDQIAQFMVPNGATPDPNDTIGIPGLSTFENLTGTDAAGGDDLTGDIGANIIRGLGGADAIHGGDGNDELIGGKGGDVLRGGDGVDLANYEDSFEGVDVSLASGNGFGGTAEGDNLKSIFATSDIENLKGSKYGDTLTGNGENNLIDPYLSSFPVDTLLGGTGKDIVDGGGGTDTLFINYLDHGDFGTGLVGGFSKGSVSSGHIQRDVLGGGSPLDVVDFSAIDKLIVLGTFRDDQIFGGLQGDVIIAGGGDDLIYAGIGADHVEGQEGNDTVWAGTGIDQELLPSKVDFGYSLSGGEGIDTLSVSFGGLQTSIFLFGTDGTEENPDSNISLPGISIREFEILQDVTGGELLDLILQPGFVDNIFKGRGGEDLLFPGLGNDVVDGGSDDFGMSGDILFIDYSSYGGIGGIVSTEPEIYLDVADDAFTTKGSYDLPFDILSTGVEYSFIERLSVIGTDNNDLIYGTWETFLNEDDGGPAIAAFGDVDLSVSAAHAVTLRGDDILTGGKGNDTIIGLTGDDKIDGGDGDDILIGTFENGFGFNAAKEIDTITGGTGADVFVLGNEDGHYYGQPDSFWEPNPETDPALSNRAIIKDFNPGEGDKIQLFGQASNYSLIQFGTSTIIRFGSLPEVIGEIENFLAGDFSFSTHVNWADGSSFASSSFLSPLDEPILLPEALALEPEFETLSAPESFTTLSTSWITQNNNPADLLDTLFAGGGGTGIDLTTDSLELIGDGRAFGIFENDPFGLGKGIVISSGIAEELANPNGEDGTYFQTGYDLSTDFGFAGGENDTLSLTYTFSMLPGATQDTLVFQFLMFSEELVEWGGSEFNDNVKIILNGIDLGLLSDGAALTVNNLAHSPFGPYHPDFVYNPVGTGPNSDTVRADGYTQALTFSGPIQAGLNVLTIQAADLADDIYDSGILVKAGTLAGGFGGGGFAGGNAFKADPQLGPNGELPKIFEGGEKIKIPFTFNPGPGGFTEPVTVTFSVGPDLDLGNGPGQPFVHIFNPGEPLTIELCVSAPDDGLEDGPTYESIEVKVESEDATFDGRSVAPIMVLVKDPPPEISIDDVSVVEGDSGTTELIFTVSRSGGSDDPFDVSYASADDSAKDGEDYTGVGGTLSFAEGENAKTISVFINGDIDIEPNEKFFINLFGATEDAIIVDDQGLGTILSDDFPVTVCADAADAGSALPNYLGYGVTIQGFDMRGTAAKLAFGDGGMGVNGKKFGGGTEEGVFNDEIDFRNGTSERLEIRFASPVSDISVKLGQFFADEAGLGELAVYKAYDADGNEIGTGVLDPNVNGVNLGGAVWSFDIDFDGVARLDLMAANLYEVGTGLQQSDFNFQCVTFSPNGKPPDPDMTFMLYNAATNQLVREIFDGETINLADFGKNGFTIVAVPDANLDTESVRFILDGNVVKTDNVGPYDFLGSKALTFGEHDFTAVAFGADNGGGDLLLQESIHLHIVDNFTGTGGNNTLTGTANPNEMLGLGGNDVLNGAAGNDTLDGGDGKDSLTGGDGNDLLIGGTGNDTINGNAGKDMVVGGAGIDSLNGGADSDTFVFLAASDSSPGARDIIVGFAHSGVAPDLIDVSATGITGFGGAGTNPGAHMVVWAIEGTNTIVRGDTNGIAGVDFELQVNGNHPLTAAHFDFTP